MKGNVLIVDDDRAMCELLDFDLHRRGFMVQWRNRAEDAFRQVKEEDFDVVLADIHLPGMTGIELCERIVANRPDIPVITITAFGSLDSAVASIRAGAYDFVTKPIEVDILEAALNRAVSHRALQEKVKRLKGAAARARQFDDLIGRQPAHESVVFPDRPRGGNRYFRPHHG